ncbi:MAG: hypothetical protein ABWZ40_11615 [Caulobacterales bacterium]
MKFQTIALIMFAACLGACESPKPDETAPPPLAAAPEQPVAEAKCAVIENKNWQAFIDKMPGVNAKPSLRVTGEIVLPTPGFTIALKEGRADRSAIPTQHLILELTPPTGQVMQALSTETVRYDGPAIAEKYTAVQIVCAGMQLAEITDIQTVH